MVLGIVLVRQNGRQHRFGVPEWSSASFWCVRMVVGIVLVFGMVLGIVLVRQNSRRHRFGASQ